MRVRTAIALGALFIAGSGGVAVEAVQANGAKESTAVPGVSLSARRGSGCHVRPWRFTHMWSRGIVQAITDQTCSGVSRQGLTVQVYEQARDGARYLVASNGGSHGDGTLRVSAWKRCASENGSSERWWVEEVGPSYRMNGVTYLPNPVQRQGLFYCWVPTP